MSNEAIPYSGGVVELRGSSTQVLTLNTNAPVSVHWEPLDRIALDVEVRAAITQYNGLDHRVFIYPAWIRYQTAVGHGRSIWEEPPSLPVRAHFAADTTGQKQILWPIMPARGLCHRLTTRELRISFRNSGWAGNEYTERDAAGGAEFVDVEGVQMPTFPTVTLAVSIQPVYGLDTALSYRYAHWTLRDHGNVIAFPAGAREFRIFDLSARQLQAREWSELDGPIEDWDFYDEHPTRIDYIDQLGNNVGTGESTPADYIESEEWNPIPLFAWGFMVNKEAENGDGADQFTIEFR